MLARFLQSEVKKYKEAKEAYNSQATLPGSKIEKEKEKEKEQEKDLSHWLNIQKDWWQLCWNSFSLEQSEQVAEWAEMCKQMLVNCHCGCNIFAWPFGWMVQQSRKENDVVCIYASPACLPKGIPKNEITMVSIIQLATLEDISSRFQLWVNDNAPGSGFV